MHKIFYILLIPFFAHGQEAQESIDRKLSHATQSFAQQSVDQYIVAIPYSKSYLGVQGSPFWGTGNWSKADILYKGSFVAEPMLKYDCSSGQMVTMRYTAKGTEFLSLVSNCYPEIVIHIDNIVSSVNTDGKSTRKLIGTTNERFIFHAVTPEESKDGISSGYFHIRIDKRVQLYCRYTREVVDRSGQKVFDPKEEFFIMKGGLFIRIRRVATLADAFPQWSDKIDAYASENQINKLLPLNTDNTISLIEFINTLPAK